MKLTPLFCSLALSYAQTIFPLTTSSVSFTLKPIATGTSTAKLVPFDIDFTSIPGYQTDSNVFLEASNSTWTSEVQVFDDGSTYTSFLSVSWPKGEGPGAVATGNNIWSACLITLPHLFDQLGITDPGNGSCFDVAASVCLYKILSTVISLWDMSIGGQTNVSESALANACSVASSNIIEKSECFGSSANYAQHLQSKPALFM